MFKRNCVVKFPDSFGTKTLSKSKRNHWFEAAIPWVVQIGFKLLDGPRCV